MKERIRTLLDRDGATAKVLSLFQEYLEKKDTQFETKMEPWKIDRVDRADWKPPVLYFSLIRHPGGLRRQTWAYDFDKDTVTLYPEGPNPQSKPYKANEDALAIVSAITENKDHSSVLVRDDLFIVNPRKISEMQNAPMQTVEGRVKRLKSLIKR